MGVYRMVSTPQQNHLLQRHNKKVKKIDKHTQCYLQWVHFLLKLFTATQHSCLKQNHAHDSNLQKVWIPKGPKSKNSTKNPQNLVWLIRLSLRWYYPCRIESCLVASFCEVIDFLQNHDVGQDRYASGALHQMPQRWEKLNYLTYTQPFKQQRREATGPKVQFDENNPFRVICNLFQFGCKECLFVLENYFDGEFISAYCPVLIIFF